MPSQPLKRGTFGLKEFWKRTSGKVIVISGFVAGITTILTSMGSVWGLFKNSKNKGVRIVDVSIGYNDTIDVKLRNTGSEVAFLKMARLHIKRSWKIVPDSGASFMKVEPTETYQVNIDSRKKIPYTIEIPVSQGIRPNDFDRFRLSLYNRQPGNDNNTYVYLADLELVMDEDNTVIKKPGLLLGFELPMQHYEQLKPQNIQSVNEINSTEGYKSQPLADLLNKIRLK